MNYAEIFLSMNPGFFEKESIRNTPPEWRSTELVMDLRKELPPGPPFLCPEGITLANTTASLRRCMRQSDRWMKTGLCFSMKATASTVPLTETESSHSAACPKWVSMRGCALALPAA